jgi:hypothetical protein
MDEEGNIGFMILVFVKEYSECLGARCELGCLDNLGWSLNKPVGAMDAHVCIF